MYSRKNERGSRLRQLKHIERKTNEDIAKVTYTISVE